MKDEKTTDTPIESWKIEEWFPDLKKDILENLLIYKNELLKFNKTVNLVSTRTVATIDSTHFADSILASRIIFKSRPNLSQIFDLGSGNGFPGLVFAMLYPQVRVTLVDSDQRKCEFLKHVIAKAKLQNVSVLNTMIERLPDDSVNFAMARGFASISKAIMVTRKCFKRGGVFYHLKSEEWGMEVSDIPTQLCSIWTPSLTGEYKLPVGPVKFAVVQTDKIV